MADSAAVFKAYDVRGVVPSELNADLSRSIGQAFAGLVRRKEPEKSSVAVARDMRSSGEDLLAAFSDGVMGAGLNVIDVGLASTDMLYFASGYLEVPGAMFTASHNPAHYNGVKFCLSGARPIGIETGLSEMRDDVVRGIRIKNLPSRGSYSATNLLREFVDHALSFINPANLASLRVAVDTANGMGGLIIPAVFETLKLELDILFPELDGSFPNHPPDPLQPENLIDLQKRIVATSADVGLAFDGDADRVFFVDEKGQLISGTLITAVLARTFLGREPGAGIVHNLICGRVVPETITEYGGRAVRTRVGHSFIKSVMAEESAIFGGEHSGHYYFRDNWRADSGVIASLIMLEELSVSRVPLSELLLPFRRYVDSGEINVSVDDPEGVIEHVARHYTDLPQDRLDGLTVEANGWWFNLRPSNTEPLLRLNLEATNEVVCTGQTADVVSTILEVDGNRAFA